jgi:AraC family transcriptional regulator of adaptative response/methylated-DNA-[protein]-cysteine methyltransferase
LRFDTEDERWKALVQRDGRADGHFFYGVLSTGVYCRPGCPARLARRENVRFHSTRGEAESAGFRPCKRCQPELAHPGEQVNVAVARACAMLEGSPEPPSLATLAAAAGLSPWHFHRLFKATTGLTPRAYAAARRIARLKAELRERHTITDAIYSSGFGSSGPFYANARSMLGMTPRAFRSAGAGETIRHGTTKCSLGWLLVAATDKGICEIALGDARSSLVAALRERYAKATLVRQDKTLRTWIAKAVAFIDDPTRGLGLPLDVRGTAFQYRVWQALSAIPPGSTVSYRELAQRLGIPQSVRAVASACAANRIAVAIPCHRAVGGDGSLTGYRWGIGRKRRLLEREQTTTAAEKRTP